MIPVRSMASFGYLLRHPWQLALALLGIGIGVAVIVAVDLANASARKAFVLSMDAVTGEATHHVIGGPRGVDEQVYVSLRTRHGLRSIAPVVTGTVEVAAMPFDALGIDLFAEQALRPFTRQVSSSVAGDGGPNENLFRQFLTEAGAVTMSDTTAALLGIEVGDVFSLVAGGIEHPGRLIGIYEGEQAGLDNLIVTDIATAQSWFGYAGRLSRIDARVVTDADLARLEGLVPGNARVISAAGRTQATAAMSQAFMTNLTAMSLLALLVGLFLIFNSFSFSVLQRRNLIGTLRALGMTRRQLLVMILTEAIVLGVIASIAGLVAGLFLGEQLLALVSQSINDLYFRVSVTEVSIGSASIVKGLVAGVGAALLAAAVPAIEATSFAPRLAMLRSTLEHRTGQALPRIAIAGVLSMVLAVGLLYVSDRNLVAGLVAVFLLILGFSFCVPLVVRWAADTLAPVAQALAGTVARIALGGLAAGLSRAAVAVVALAVAVSATIGVSVMVDSFRGSVESWLEQSLQADVYTGVFRGTIDPALAVEIGNIAGVIAVSTSRRSTLEGEAGRTRLLAIDMAPGGYAGTELLDGPAEQVWARWENDDSVLVSEPYAYRNEVRAGDVITLRTRSGPREFLIAARYKSYDVNASAVLMSRANYDRYFEDDGIDTLGLYLADDANPEHVIARIRSISDGRQRLRVDSNARIRELSLEIFDRTFIITDVLYWLALGVALVGILGAMLALQLERGREFATLRALGMTRGQVGCLVTAQTGFMGLLSGFAAIPLGVMMAWVLIKVINRRAFGWQIDMVVAPGILASALFFAVLAAMLAGLYPAWRASRGLPAHAMREE